LKVLQTTIAKIGLGGKNLQGPIIALYIRNLRTFVRVSKYISWPEIVEGLYGALSWTFEGTNTLTVDFEHSFATYVADTKVENAKTDHRNQIGRSPNPGDATCNCGFISWWPENGGTPLPASVVCLALYEGKCSGHHHNRLMLKVVGRQHCGIITTLISQHEGQRKLII
jgi:hypothetical protein